MNPDLLSAELTALFESAHKRLIDSVSHSYCAGEPNHPIVSQHFDSGPSIQMFRLEVGPYDVSPVTVR